MPANLIDIISSLTTVMTEETGMLQAGERGRDLAELASVKIRLTGILETELARLNREAGWSDNLADSQWSDLSEAIKALNEASRINAGVLERQIDLSIELMGALAAEAWRLQKKRAETYGATGTMAPREPTLPISINSEY